MVIKLYVRTAPNDRTSCTLRVDYKLENGDSVRVNNLGMEIVDKMQEIVGNCEKRGEVSI